MERIFTEIEEMKKTRPFLSYAKLISHNDVKIRRNHFMKKNSNIIECGFPGPAILKEYENSYFIIYIIVENYPYKAPKVIFKSQQYHPNIYSDGLVCLDLLSSGYWKPTLGIVDIIYAIQNLLECPNPNSPANETAAGLYARGQSQYIKVLKKNICQFNSLKTFFSELK